MAVQFNILIFFMHLDYSELYMNIAEEGLEISLYAHPSPRSTRCYRIMTKDFKEIYSACRQSIHASYPQVLVMSKPNVMCHMFLMKGPSMPRVVRHTAVTTVKALNNANN